jgi:1-acyl-sn-glycerol-3-phosphate acyltransferase
MRAMSSLRSILITAPMIIISTIVYGTIGFLISFFDATGDKQMKCARAWSRVLLAVSGVKVHVEGIEQITPNCSYVFASNHLSYMDTPVVLANIPVQFRFLAKKGLFQIPLVGTHLARAGHIAVPREDPRAAVKIMTQAAQIIRERGTSLLVFPEGGRSHDGELQDFKEGAAYIAIKAGVPLVPIALKGTREVLPFGSGKVLAGPVTMRIGPPLPTENLKMHDRDRVTQELRGQIVGLLGDTVSV